MQQEPHSGPSSPVAADAAAPPPPQPQPKDALAARALRRPAEALNLHRALQPYGLASGTFAEFIESTSPTMLRDDTGKHPRMFVDDQRFSGRTFFYFTVTHYLRIGAIQLVTHPVYQALFVLLILLSTVTLTALPSERSISESKVSAWEYIVLVLDRFLSILFILEFVVEFVAQGVIKTVRSSEYTFDLIVVLAGVLLDVVSHRTSRTVLLVVSSLRPVRIIRRIAGLRRLLRFVACGGLLLVNVFLLILCIMVALALAGVIFFGNAMHMRCYNPTTLEYSSLCSVIVDSDTSSALFTACAPGTVCTAGAPTPSKYESFDNMGYSLLIMLQLFTLDNWTNLAVELMNSLSPAAGLFFVLATFMLAFWATNLLTAVVLWAFQEQFKAEQENKREARAMEQSRKEKAAKTFREKLLEQLAVRHTSSPKVVQLNPNSARGLRNAKAAQVIGDFKKGMAKDAVTSLRNGYPSVTNVNDILRNVHEEYTQEQVDAAVAAAAGEQDGDGVESDFVLNEQGMEIELRDAVELEKLERAIKVADPTVHDMLQVVKNGRYNSEQDQLRAVRYFVYMDDVSRQKLIRTVQWRDELAEAWRGADPGGSTYEPPILVVPTLAETPGDERNNTSGRRASSLVANARGTAGRRNSAMDASRAPTARTLFTAHDDDRHADADADRHSSTDSFVSRHSELDSDEDDARVAKLRRRVTTHDKERRLAIEQKKLWKQAMPILREQLRRRRAKKLQDAGIRPDAGLELEDDPDEKDSNRKEKKSGKEAAAAAAAERQRIVEDDDDDLLMDIGGGLRHLTTRSMNVLGMAKDTLAEGLDDLGALLGNTEDVIRGSDTDSLASLIHRRRRMDAKEERRRKMQEPAAGISVAGLANRFNPLNIDVSQTLSTFASATRNLAKATVNLATGGLRAVAHASSIFTGGDRVGSIFAGGGTDAAAGGGDINTEDGLLELLLPGDKIMPPTELHAYRSVATKFEDIEESRKMIKQLRRLIQTHNDEHDVPRKLKKLSLWQLLREKWEEQGVKQRIYEALRDPLYDRFLALLCALNIVLLASSHYRQSRLHVLVITWVTGIFDVTVVLDAVARVYILGSLAAYKRIMLRNLYNMTELMVVALCVLDLIIVMPGVSPVLSCLRTLRMLKYIRYFTQLRKIFLLCRASVGYLFNLLIILAVFLFVFTHTGNQLFGPHYQVSSTVISCASLLDQHACNFSPFGSCIWTTSSDFARQDNVYFAEVVRCYKFNGAAPPCRRTESPSLSVATRTHTLPPATTSHWHRGRRTDSPELSVSHSMSEADPSQSWTRSNRAPVTAAPPTNPVPTTTIAPLATADVPKCRQFKDWLRDNENYISRFSFETLLLSFITIFDVITRDEWSSIQYLYMELVGMPSCLYFIVAVVLGSYIILSVLVAVLLVNFEQQTNVMLDQLEGIFTSIEQDMLERKSELYETVLRAQHRQEYEDTLKQQKLEEEDAARQKIREELLAVEAANMSLQQEKQERKKKQSGAHPGGAGEGAGSDSDDESSDEEDEEEKEMEEKEGGSAEKSKKATTDLDALETEKKAKEAAAAESGAVADGKAKRRRKRGRFRRHAKHARQLLEGGVSAVRNNAFLKFIHVILLKIYNFCDVEDTKIDKTQLQGKSLFFFSSTNKYRLFACDVVSGRYFRVERSVFWLSVLHVIVSPASIVLLDSEATLLAFGVMDWILTVLSVVEMLCRVVAQGGFLGSRSYLRSGKDRLFDFGIVCGSFTANCLPVLFSNATALGFALKGIRPGRIIPRSRTMRNVLIAVLQATPDMGNIFFLSAVVYFMYSIICVDLFMGRFRICSDGSDRSENECIGTWVATASDKVFLFPKNATSMVLERRWTNTQWFHFDDLWNAFSCLLQVSMVSTWSPVMFAAMDAPMEVGGSPVRNRNASNSAWIILWVIASNYFLMNVFIGTVVGRFTALKNQMQGSVFATEDQSVVATIKKALISKSAKRVLVIPDPPYLNRNLNESCFNIVMHPYFVNFAKAAVYLNIVTVFSIHYDQSSTWSNVQNISNISICFVFLIELCLKLGVSGVEMYFSIPTLRMDALICLLAVLDAIGIAVGFLQRSVIMEALRLIRLTRVARDLKGFRKLVESGITALPAIGNIGAVLISVMYFFGMIGISLFQQMRFDETGEWFSPMFSFRTLPKAMFLLYSVATFDVWAQVEVLAGVKPPYCSEDPAIDNCGKFWVANVYLNIYVISVGVVGLNLFIAVVLETFNETILVPTYVQVRLNDVDTFRTAWRDQDPQARMVIHASKFVPLLLSLSGPELRFKELKERRDHAGDNDSLKSWTTQEMFVYSQRQVIGLKGCPAGVIIPTINQLRLYVTLPREEILFNDALDAVAEKIFHAPIADERVKRAEELIRERGTETRVLFSKWYAAERIRAIWRRLKRDKWDNRDYRPMSHLWSTALDPLVKQYVKQNYRTAWTVVHDEALRKESVHKKRKDTGGAGGGAGAAGPQSGGAGAGGGANGEDAAAASGGAAATAAAASGADGAAATAALPTSKRLAEIVKMRQVDVEELPEVEEDLRWLGVVSTVSSDASDSDVSWSDEELWLTQAARQERKRVLKARNLLGKGSKRSRGGEAATASTGAGGGEWVDPRRAVAFDLPSRIDESGSLCHYASLDEVIRFQRRQLLFQIRAQLYANEYTRQQQQQQQNNGGVAPQQPGGDTTAAALLSLPTVEQYTTVEMREMLHAANVIDTAPWTDPTRLWRPLVHRPVAELEPPDEWRAALGVPLQLRPAGAAKRRIAPRVGGLGGLRADKASWDTYFAVRPPSDATAASGDAAVEAAATAAAASGPKKKKKRGGQEKDDAAAAAAQALSSATAAREAYQDVDYDSFQYGVAPSKRPPLLLRLPTLEEEMERRGLPTTHMKAAAAAAAAAAASTKAPSSTTVSLLSLYGPTGGGGGGSNSAAAAAANSGGSSCAATQLSAGGAGGVVQERVTLRSLMSSMDDPALPKDQRYVPTVVGMTYGLPKGGGPAEDAVKGILRRLSLGMMMRMSLAATRFKRRKQREAAAALQLTSQRVAGAASMYSRATKNTSNVRKRLPLGAGGGGGLLSTGGDGDGTTVTGENTADRGMVAGLGKGLVNVGFKTLTGMKDIFRRKKQTEDLDDDF